MAALREVSNEAPSRCSLPRVALTDPTHPVLSVMEATKDDVVAVSPAEEAAIISADSAALVRLCAVPVGHLRTALGRRLEVMK